MLPDTRGARYQLIAAFKCFVRAEPAQVGSYIRVRNALMTQRRAQSLRIIREQFLRRTLVLKRAMVARPFGLRRIGLHRPRERGGMRARKHGQTLEFGGELRCNQPRQLAAPVVAHQVEALVSQRLRHGARIGDEPLGRIVFNLARTRVWRVTALVRRHREVARGGERRQLMAPRMAGLREAVQQQHQRRARHAGDIGFEDEPIGQQLELPNGHGFATLPINSPTFNSPSRVCPPISRKRRMLR